MTSERTVEVEHWYWKMIWDMSSIGGVRSFCRYLLSVGNNTVKVYLFIISRRVSEQAFVNLMDYILLQLNHILISRLD